MLDVPVVYTVETSHPPIEGPKAEAWDYTDVGAA